jgi:hypothetical protein
MPMNDPRRKQRSILFSSFLLSRHSVLDTESSRVLWIPAFAGMTTSRQAAGNEPEGIQIVRLLRAYGSGVLQCGVRWIR